MADSPSIASVVEGRLHSEPTIAPANGHPKPKQPKAKAKSPPAPKPKANKILATDRITHPKQMELLRAYAIASGTENRAVTNEEVAKIVKMQASTVALANAFFTTLGFLQKTEAGFVPSAEVINFDRAFQWNAETAGTKLAPLIDRAWFMQALTPRLRFQNSMEENEAIQLLASESAAAPHHRKQLQLLLEYGAASGLIERDNGIVRIKQSAGQSASAQERPVAPLDAGLPTTPPPHSPLASALFPSTANGAVQFNISVQVNMAELAGWTPDRIASFFGGIAQVLAARGKEKDTE